jgi:hypothetical protein
MHRLGHFFDLTIITLGTSNFDLTPTHLNQIIILTFNVLILKSYYKLLLFQRKFYFKIN